MSSAYASANRVASAPIKGKEKEKALSTPSATPGASRPTVSKDKDDVMVKKEEIESRVLRTRPSTSNPVEAVKEAPKKKEVLRGPDGKPLPTCATCGNVLPLIVVDQEIVWGLGPESKKAKKKQECPRYVFSCHIKSYSSYPPFLRRCLRHFAIYQQPWPVRNPAPGTTIAFTPRPPTPVDHASKSSKKVLKYLKRQAEEASLAPKKRQREELDDPSPRPQKIPKGRERIVIRVRPSAPEPSSSKTVKAAPEDTSAKRKRGRPRLSSSNPIHTSSLDTSQVTVKVEEEDGGVLSFKDTFPQPRAQNGRFGRKDKAPRKINESVSASRSPRTRSEKKPDSASDARSIWTSPRRKRPMEGILDDQQDSPRKSARTAADEQPESSQRVLPRRSSGLKLGSLLSNPNPMRFARHAWKGPVLLDDSSSEDDSTIGPETPEDLPSPAPEIITVEDDDDDGEIDVSTLVLSLPAARAPLTYKPSPHAFSKRRWDSLNKLPERLASLDKGKARDEVPQRDEEEEGVEERLPKVQGALVAKSGPISSRWTTKNILADNPVSGPA